MREGKSQIVWFMTMRKIFFILPILISSLLTGQTQIGFRMLPGLNKVEIPFEQINNLVVIPVVINDFLKLKFVVDTGVETTILTEPAYVPLLDIEFYRKITISGAGINDSINAYVAKDVALELPGGVYGKNMNLIVLEDDFLKLSERMGMDVQGIIGHDIFNQFVVEFDYKNSVINLYRPKKYRPRRRWTEVDMDVVDSKPFITAKDESSGEFMNLMVDSGASHALLLDPEQTNVAMPEKMIETRLGTGLGGEINGKLGRMDAVSISEFEFNDVLVSIPNPDAYSKLIKRGSRQGTIGGEILSRLNPVFDYQNEKVYLTKNRNFNEIFEADMCGIDLIVKGPFLDTLYIDYVRKDSPADKAGLEKGDVVFSVNGHSLNYSPFGRIQSMLKGRPNRKVKFKVIRNGEKLKLDVRLKRQI